MAKVRIELYAKDLSLDCDPIEMETHFIPQVGELIDAGEYVKKPHGASPYYIVLSVVHELTKDGFIPRITCHSWYKGMRSELLRRRGWLPPDGSKAIVHDEADGHLSDDPS